MPTVNHKPRGGNVDQARMLKRRVRSIERKGLGTASGYVGGAPSGWGNVTAASSWVTCQGLGPIVQCNVGSSGLVYVSLTVDVVLGTVSAVGYMSVLVDNGANPTFDTNFPPNVTPFAVRFGAAGVEFSGSSTYMTGTASGQYPLLVTPGIHTFTPVAAVAGPTGAAAQLYNPSLIVTPG